MAKWIKIIIALLLLAGGGYWAYAKLKPEPAPVVEPQPPITFEVTQETISQTIQVKGKSAYTEQTEVYAPIGGKVSNWSKKNGDAVKKGELLLSLETKTLQSEIKSMESDIRKSRLEIKQQELARQLPNSESIGDTEDVRKTAALDRENKRLAYELGKESLSIKESELAQKKSALAAAAVKAPVSGVFVYGDQETKSQMLSEGQLIGKIINTELIQFKSVVSEQFINQIKPGMPVQVQLQSNKEQKFTGKITIVSRFPSATSSSDASQPSQFDIVVSLQADKLLIGGLTLEGQIETQRKENATVVPTLAILRDGSNAYVTLDKGNGETIRQDIKTGLEVDDKTEVLEGLKPGEVVVLE